MAVDIKFGTDGWRAIIADTFTIKNLETVTLATAMWLKETNDKPSVIIGYDTRYAGERFSTHVARVFASQGISSVLSQGHTTTPAVSLATVKHGKDAGIVFTASHNPPSYSGFKIKASFGGPALPAQIDAVEKYLEEAAAVNLELATSKEYQDQGLISMSDLNAEYLAAIRAGIDIDAIKNSDFKVAYDAMHGAGLGLIAELLGADKVTELRNDFNPSFGGQAPEPIEKNLQDLKKLMEGGDHGIGLATDGDADRIGLFDEKGNFVDSHRILCLLVDFLHNDREMRGDIVKTFSCTDMLDRLAEDLDIKIHTTKIGFKYIAPIIVDGNVLVGGEESGGMAVAGHIPERDGIYIGLLMAEMMVKRNMSLSALVEDLFERYGSHYCVRNDAHLTQKAKEEVIERLGGEGLASAGSRTTEKKEEMDGYKFRMNDGTWVMIRPSGTEPVLRIYAEAKTPEAAQELITDTCGVLGI